MNVKSISEASGKDVRLLTVLFLFVVVVVFIPSTIACRICAASLFIACILMGRKEPRLVNPYYLFSLTPLSLTLYSEVAGGYMLTLSHSTWVLAIINIYAFIFALFVTPSFKSIKNCIGVSNTSGLIIGAFIMYGIYLASRIVPELNALFWFTSIAAMVFALRSKKKIGLVFCAYLFLSSIFSGHSSKMEMLLYVLTFLICYDKFYSPTRKQRMTVAALAAIGVVFMIFAFSFANKERGQYDAESGQAYYEQQGNFEWDYDSALLMPYLYFSTPWTNVEYVVQTQDERTNGLWMIKPILGYLGVDEKFSREYELIPYSSFNTFTFICCGFKDFGYWLSILSSLFLGFFVKKMYSRYLISKSPFDVTSYILVALATVEMFFSNHFFMQSYPFTVLIMMELYKYITYFLGANRKLDIE